MVNNPYNPAFGAVPTYYVTNSWISDKFLSGLDNLTDKWRETIVTGIRGSGKTTVISDIIGKSATRDDVVVISGNAGTSDLLPEIVAGMQRKLPRLPKLKTLGVKLPAIFDLGFEMPTKSASFRYDIEDMLTFAQTQGVTVVIAIDEVQKHSEALRDYVAAYQQWKMQKLPVATILAGLPSAINDMLNDDVLTFFKRANQIKLAALDEQDILTNYAQVFGDRVPFTLINAMAEGAANYAFMFQLIGFNVWLMNKTAYTKDDIDSALEVSKRGLFKAVYEPMITDLSQNDQRVIRASLAAMDGKVIVYAKLRELSGMNENSISTYRLRLINAEILTIAGRGLLKYKQPYFKEFLESYYIEI
ncbi:MULTISPECIES: ATP-binding protein [unclassified Leuconostoc]|uniref:ATP-binding protein n=1 Tax=unclassified Leuconostoc TaxID=2685106 RepID=UPI001903C666|nr:MULTISPECIES: ATP-binding protein [unclassified Leuconostoc]MBK0041557.1 ATP-binding protein [Leuconostoc sp. S51]MBK0052550.1 ATP-binding protein [Leuconostoc sp. S50]